MIVLLKLHALLSLRSCVTLFLWQKDLGERGSYFRILKTPLTLDFQLTATKVSLIPEKFCFVFKVKRNLAAHTSP